ncbi:MAG: PHP domain-containing protein [Solirubrobacteraceae bacterium]
MEEQPFFDLQSHSTCSDGALEPAEVVALAARSGVRLLALPDHDTVGGVAEARAAAAGHSIALVPAAEISTVQGDLGDLHVLGYGLDERNPQLLEVLSLARADRAARAAAMGDALRGLGFQLDASVLERQRSLGRALGRPHLAAAVTSHPGNAERLRAERCEETSSFLVAYLTPGAPAFVARAAPTVVGAIELIHGAGGLAVWAHPFWDIHETPAALAALGRFAEDGLDGVECFYPAHSEAQTRALHARAQELGLLCTGSGDFHGPRHAHFNAFGKFRTYGLKPQLGRLGEAVGERL